MAILTKNKRRHRIHLRIRKTIVGTSVRPRLSVFRSNKEIYAQVIDDINQNTFDLLKDTREMNTKLYLESYRRKRESLK